MLVPGRLAIADGAGVPVPPERDARLAALAAELEAEGFRPLATVAPSDPDAEATIYARVLVHDAERIRAWVVDQAHGDILNTYVELVTEWEAGPAVATLSMDFPSAFADPPRVRRFKLAAATVPEVLAAHRAAGAGTVGPRLDPAARDPIEVANEQNREVLEHQVKRGLLKRRGDDYVFTFAGAVRSVRGAF